MPRKSFFDALHHFYNNSDFFYCVMECDGSLTEVNDRWKKTFVNNKNSGSKLNIYDFVALEEITGLNLTLEQIFKAKISQYETQMNVSDKEFVVIEWNVKIEGSKAYHVGRDVTIYRQSELINKEQVDFYNTVLDNAGVGHWKYKFANREFQASDNALILFGSDPNAELNIKDLMYTLNSKGRENVAAAIKELVEEQKNFSLDVTILAGKNNGQKYGSITGKVIYDQAHNPSYIYGTTQDITDRKNVEIELFRKNEEFELQSVELRKLNEKLVSVNEQLVISKANFEERERNYREIFENASDAIIVHDAKTFAIVDVNATMVKMYGYSSKKEAVIQSIDKLSVKSEFYNSEKAKDLLRKVAATNTQETIEWHMQTQGGAPFWVEVSLKQATINGKARILASLRDISKRKAAQHALKKSQDHLSSVLNNMEEVAWSHEMPGNNLVYMSSSSEKLLGFTPEEFLQDPDLWKKTIHPLDLEYVLDEITNFKPKTYFELEYRINTLDGKIRWVRDRTKVTYDGHGEPTRIDGLVSDITSQKEAELKYSTVEQRYRELVEISVDGIAIGNADGLIIEANQQFLNIIGETLEGVKKKHITDFFDDKEIATNPFRYDLLQQGEVVIRERFINGANGQKTLVEMRSKKMTDNILQSVIRDITDRRNAEDEIAYRVELQNLVISLGTRFFNVRSREIDIAISQSLKEIGSFTKVDRAYTFLYDHDNRTQTNTHEWCALGIQPMISENQEIPISLTKKEYQIHLKGESYYFSDIEQIADNKEFYEKLKGQNVVSMVTIPMIYNQKCYGFVGFDTVLHPRKWKEEDIAVLKLFADLLVNFKIKTRFESTLRDAKFKAQTNEKQVRGLVDMSPIGILNVAPDGVIFDLNDAAVKILGSPSKEMTMSLNLYKVRQLEEVGFLSDFSRCVKEKIVVKNGMQYRSVWGKDAFTRYYLVPIMVDDELSSILINIEDVTEIEEARQKLINLKEKAEESDRLKSAFLANMSHEIRTPMNGIIGFAELMNEASVSDQEKRQYLKIITNNAYHLLDLINDIIDISKIEAGQTNVNINETNLNLILTDVFMLLQPISEKKGLDFSYSTRLSDSNSFAVTDFVKVKQILFNLVNNSLKFTENGSVQFGYEIESDYIKFYVKDTGCGIPEKSRSVVFDRFLQLDNQPKESRTGTGLGLAISKAYVELLGGEIGLTSEVGKGTQFIFTIPYKKVLRIYGDSQPKKKSLDWTSKTILLAEDDYPNRIFVTEVLKKTNVTVVAVGSGQEAVDMVKKGTIFDLVLMDLKMPNMDGIEATIEILKINNRMPIIAQTAYAFAEDVAIAKNAGCVDFISKPMKAVELLSMVEKYLF
ncbi:MAG: PAS domain S-box protein [Salinivirgaceae bacterium]|nr:PAS domain S-box protein [Salinivirgaceae bacterium]